MPWSGQNQLEIPRWKYLFSPGLPTPSPTFLLAARHLRQVLRYFSVSLSSYDVMKHVSSCILTIHSGSWSGSLSPKSQALFGHDSEASQSEIFTSLEVPCLRGFTLLVLWNGVWERGRVQWIENRGMKWALMGKVMVHLRGMGNCAISMRADGHFIPPQTQFLDQHSGHIQ